MDRDIWNCFMNNNEQTEHDHAFSHVGMSKNWIGDRDLGYFEAIFGK